MEVAENEISLIESVAICISEDQISRGCWRLTFGHFFRCRATLFLQKLEYPILELYHAPAARAFGIGELPAAAFDRLERSRHAESSLLAIDVQPLQGKIFAWAHSGGQREGEQHVISILLGGFEKVSGLLRSQYLDLTFRLAGKIHVFGGIDRDEAPFYSLVQRSTQDCVSKPDSAS